MRLDSFLLIPAVKNFSNSSTVGKKIFHEFTTIIKIGVKIETFAVQ